MSKEALESLMRGVSRYSQLKRELGKTGETPGKLYRQASYQAPHIVQLSKKVVREQLKAMITDTAGLNLQTVSNTKLNSLTDIVHGNIIAALEKKGFKYDRGSQCIYIKGEGTEAGAANNFRRINEAFNQAFGGNKAYGPFFDFLIKELDEEQSIQVELFKNDLVLSAQAESARTNKKVDPFHGYGFDAGHVEANITAALKAVVWNSLKQEFKAGQDFRNHPAIAEELSRVTEEWRKITSNAVAGNVLYDYLIKEKIITGAEEGKNLVAGFFEHTLEFAKEIATGEAKAALKTEVKLKDRTSLQKIAKEVVVSIIPEYARANQDKGSTLEKNILYQMEELGASEVKRLNSVFKDWVAGRLNIPGIPQLSELPGSKTLNQMIDTNLGQLLEFGKAAPQRANTKAKKEAKSKVGKAKPNIGKSYTLGLDKKPLTRLSIFRNSVSRFVSLSNVVNIINMQLAEKIRQNMGSPRLNYRTGRFAKSAQLLTPSVGGTGLVTLPFTYMKYPYQTFEPGFAKGSIDRDPYSLISQSIREIATKLVVAKLRIVRV